MICKMPFVLLTVTVGINLQLYSSVAAFTPEEVQTDSAIYIGKILSLDRPYQSRSFFGIPFAAPPVGSRRFAPPEPWVADNYLEEDEQEQEHLKWRKVSIIANESKPLCMQPTTIDNDAAALGGRQMSEDCLYLNLHSPNSRGSTKNLKVILWLHGGYYRSGGTSDANDEAAIIGWNMCVRQKIVFVEAAYRLGVFGFLSADDSEVKGNFGLQDQQLAMQWIAENIRFFGGNATAVTVMGIDSGAASTGLHLLNEQSSKLFARAFFLGGSPLAPWSLPPDKEAVRSTFKSFYSRAGCVYESIQLTVECLRNLSAEDLNSLQFSSSSIDLFSDMQFPVVVDGDFVKSDPFLALQSAGFQQKPVVVGVTSSEGNKITEELLKSLNVTDVSNLIGDVYDSVLRYAFRYFPAFPQKINSFQMEFLQKELTAFSSSTAGGRNLQLLVRSISNFVSDCSTNTFIDLLAASNSSNVFAYVFAEPDPNSTAEAGASHGKDAEYFLDSIRNLPQFDQQQKELSVFMTEGLSNFLDLEGIGQIGDWPPTDTRSLSHFYFVANRRDQSAASSVRSDGFQRQQCRLWQQTLPWLSQLRPETSTAAPQTTATQTSTVTNPVTVTNPPTVTNRATMTSTESNTASRTTQAATTTAESDCAACNGFEFNRMSTVIISASVPILLMLLLAIAILTVLLFRGSRNRQKEQRPTALDTSDYPRNPAAFDNSALDIDEQNDFSSNGQPVGRDPYSYTHADLCVMRNARMVETDL